MTEELKPCPNCKGKVNFIRQQCFKKANENILNVNFSKLEMIECENCQHLWKFKYPVSTELAIKSWNEESE